MFKGEKGKRAKDIIVTIIIMACMLFLGVVIDCLYYMRHSIPGMESFVVWCYVLLQPFGITYTSALDMIGGTVGIIITMVGLFLSTNINLVQRSEKNTFGIAYREIQNLKGGKWQKAAKYTKRMSCLAPFVLMFVLNFRLCVTGYLLYFYCCVSVLLQYGLYASSFSRSEIPHKVVAVLLNQLSGGEEGDSDDVQGYDMRLLAVARSIKTEGNWLEVEHLFTVLLQEAEMFEDTRQQLIVHHFYRIVCCGQSDNTELVYRIWNLYLRRQNQKAVQSVGQENEDGNGLKIEAGFWGMLQGALHILGEKELIFFIQVFLDFRKQGIEAISAQEEGETGKILGERMLNRRCCLILIFLECRFRTTVPTTVELVRLVEQLKLYGYSEMENAGNSGMLADIFRYVESMDQQKMMMDIIEDLICDRKDKRSKCCINSLPMA